MNENIVKSKENRRKIYISLLVSVICLIGLTYALFTIFLKQTENNSLATRTCFSTSLTEETSKITLENAYPLTNEKGLETTPFTFKLTNNCSNYVKAYITIDSTYRTSTDSSYLSDSYIRTNLSLKNGGTKNSVIIGKQKLRELDNNRQGYVIDEILLDPNDEREYDLRLWMDQNVTVEQGLNKTWKGSLVVTAVAETPPEAPDNWYEAEEGTLLAAMRKDNSLSVPVTTPGKEVTAYSLDDVAIQTATVSTTYQSYYITYGTGWEENDANFNLTGVAVTTDTYANSYASLVGKYLVSSSISGTGSSTAGARKTTTNLEAVYYVVNATPNSFTYKPLYSNKNTTEAILASTEDDYGTSYYYRGVVKNNYVEYANMCWRIVRVTGNGAIKLVLHNRNDLSSSNTTPKYSNPCNVTGNYLSYAFYSIFNSSSKDNAFVGLMYGNAGCSDGTSANQDSCTSAGGTWTRSTSYAQAHANTNPSIMLNKLNDWYTNVLSKQNGFDASHLADTIWCNDKKTEDNGLGYGVNNNDYASYVRINDLKSPSLICPNDNLGGKLSKFTVSDTKYGNGALKDYAKIGLLTADEVAFAGVIGKYHHTDFYLSENANVIGSLQCWWTLSPNTYAGGAAVRCVNAAWQSLDASYTNYSFPARPSISLVPDIKISSGAGTATDPYKIAV